MDSILKFILGEKGMESFQRDPLAFLRVTIFIAIILAIGIWWVQGLLYAKQLADKDSEISYLKSRRESGAGELSLNPQQEKLLMLIDKYQVQFGVRKLVIGAYGLVYPDESSRKDAKINIADELLGEKDIFVRAKELEAIIDSMPPKYLKRLPARVFGDAFVVTVTDAGRKYLKGQ